MSMPVPATARVCFWRLYYNTREDIDALVQALHTVLEVFS
jgi:selenocysteine lyase/cysteine desulfurase